MFVYSPMPVARVHLPQLLVVTSVSFFAFQSLPIDRLSVVGVDGKIICQLDESPNPT